jgi:hypothetical protein
VTQHLENPATPEREVRALEDAIKGLNAHSALILANTSESCFEINGIPIEVQSPAEWMAKTKHI